MTDRILDFAGSAATLSLREGLLVITRAGMEAQTVPLSDIAVIMVSHPQVVFTQALVAALAQAGGVLVCCDQRHHPAAMLLPLEAHFIQAERFRKQASASLPAQKRMWKELVRAKIEAQGAVLAELHGQDRGLRELSRRVRSGDSGNLESVAAQRYWPQLFADAGFRRGNEADPRNSLLNYGYAVMRAATARAVCAAGLHPSLGVHHANRYNAFCLADDLMEPLRPLVDRTVATWCAGREASAWGLDKTAKSELIASVTARYRVAGESRTLFDILTRTTQALATALTEPGQVFHFPDVDAAR